MAKSALRGTLALTLAQAYHALTGYLIFIAVARLMGQERYGVFTLVLWTMTTVETFVVDGVPRAISYATARRPEAARAIQRLGIRLTMLLGVVFTAGLAAASPLLSAHWETPETRLPIMLAALDIVAFVPFAAYVQSANGLQDYQRQALTWFQYSTLKMLCVTSAVAFFGTLESAALGYVVASFSGSIGAVLIGRKPLEPRARPTEETPSSMLGFGFPVATQGLSLLLLVNLDLSAAKAAGLGKAVFGAYGAAATLARAIFFIFRAFGEGLFPAVARAREAGEPLLAQKSARKGLALLFSLLLPIVGVATGTAETTLRVLFDDEGYTAGAVFLRPLAIAAALFALTAVFAALTSASARPWRIAGFLLVLVILDWGIVYTFAGQFGGEGAASGAAVAAGIGAFASAILASRALGSIIPWRALLVSCLVGVGLHFGLDAIAPRSWWVFPVGGAAFAAGAAVALALGGFLTMKRGR